MYIAIDLILAITMLFSVITAVKRGFVLSLFKLVSLLAAILIAIFFYKDLGTYFNDSFVNSSAHKYVEQMGIEEKIEGYIKENVNAPEGFDIPEGTDLSANVEIPKEANTILEYLDIDVDEFIAKAVENTSGIIEELTDKLAVSISNIIAFVVLLLGSLIALNIISFILDKIMKLPVLSGINKLLGFAFGACEAMLLGIVFANIAATVCGWYSAIEPSFNFANITENTYVARFLLSIYHW